MPQLTLLICLAYTEKYCISMTGLALRIAYELNNIVPKILAPGIGAAPTISLLNVNLTLGCTGLWDYFPVLLGSALHIVSTLLKLFGKSASPTSTSVENAINE